MNKNATSFLEGLALISHLGFVIAIPIVGGAFLGNYMDKKLQTNLIFLLTFVILGTAVGIYNAYRLILSVEPHANRKRKK